LTSALQRAGAIAVLLAAACRTSTSSSPEATPPPSLDVAIRGETLTIDGVALRFGAPFGEWKRALPGPFRGVDRAGGLEVWDEAGVFLVMATPFGAADPHVAGVWFALRPGAADGWPRQPFKGRLNVDGLEVTAATTGGTLQRNWPAEKMKYEHPERECSHVVGYRTRSEQDPLLAAVYMTSQCPDPRRPGGPP